MIRRLAPLALVACLGLSACGKDEADAPTAADAGDTTEAAAPATTSAGCKVVEAPAPRAEEQVAKPTKTLSKSATHTVRLDTSCGPIVIELDVERAPKTASSFASLAERGFYDGLTFHRVAAGFVIQGGDPLGTGEGSSGYRVVEAPPSDLQYTRGVVAMAKTQAEEAGTSGSQFFIVTGEDVGLPPEYALVGKVTGSFDAVDKIEATPADAQQQAQETVVIEKATLAP